LLSAEEGARSGWQAGAAENLQEGCQAAQKRAMLGGRGGVKRKEAVGMGRDETPGDCVAGTQGAAAKRERVKRRKKILKNF
jgi:hypothetical protein